MIIALLHVQILKISLDFGRVERVLSIFINPHEEQIGLLLLY